MNNKIIPLNLFKIKGTSLLIEEKTAQFNRIPYIAKKRTEIIQNIVELSSSGKYFPKMSETLHKVLNYRELFLLREVAVCAKLQKSVLAVLNEAILLYPNAEIPLRNKEIKVLRTMQKSLTVNGLVHIFSRMDLKLIYSFLEVSDIDYSLFRLFKEALLEKNISLAFNANYSIEPESLEHSKELVSTQV